MNWGKLALHFYTAFATFYTYKIYVFAKIKSGTHKPTFKYINLIESSFLMQNTLGVTFLSVKTCSTKGFQLL
jgi:hypothetical protein